MTQTAAAVCFSTAMAPSCLIPSPKPSDQLLHLFCKCLTLMSSSQSKSIYAGSKALCSRLVDTQTGLHGSTYMLELLKPKLKMLLAVESNARNTSFLLSKPHSSLYMCTYLKSVCYGLRVSSRVHLDAAGLLVIFQPAHESHSSYYVKSGIAGRWACRTARFDTMSAAKCCLDCLQVYLLLSHAHCPTRGLRSEQADCTQTVLLFRASY